MVGTAGTDDYTTVTTTVTILAGQLTGSTVITVPSTVDDINEPDETFTVVGTVTSGNTDNTNPIGTGTILNDDPLPTVLISNEQETEGDALVFTVTLSNPSSVDTVVEIETMVGTAGTDDYTSVITTVIILAGETTGSTTITVFTTVDGFVEDDETFTVNGTVTSGNTFNTNPIGTGTILNDDFAPETNDDGPKDTDMNEDILIDILENDLYIPTCGTITLTQPEHGTVVLLDNGTPNDPSDDFVTYTPNLDYYGADSFTYTLCDCFDNCDTATVTINVGTVRPTCEVEVFNAISPDGDGINDVLVIWGLDCHPNNTVQIFNRWGVEVYNTTAYATNDNYFRGVSEGRVTLSQGEELPVGTYYYIIEYLNTTTNSRQQKAGYLYLNR